MRTGAVYKREVDQMSAKHPSAGKYIRLGLFRNLNSFPELEERISALPDKDDKGKAFEVFAEFHLATKRRNDFKEIWPLAAVPRGVRGELGIRLEDYGIDGVCLNHLGIYDVYQVKFRSHGSVLNWANVSTFYGLADSDKIDSKILFSNCADVVPVIKERKGAVFILGDKLDELSPEDFKQFEAWLEGGRIQTPKKEPRPDQLDAVKAINEELEKGDRASCIMACATGKTYVALWTLHALWTIEERPDKTLVFVPSLALLAQILDDWRKEGALFKYLCVCSDQTVDKESGDIKPADCGFKVTTEPGKVRRFLDSADDLPKIVLSTYQSSPVIKEALAMRGDGFDLGIFDEAHKTAGRLGRNYSLGLRDCEIPIRKRLFFTATPRHCSPVQRTPEDELVQLYSMDNPAVYGRQVYTLTVRDAIRKDIICPYRVLISTVTTAEVHEVLVKGDLIRARQVANQIALRDAIEKYQIKKVFSFHSSVASAQSFVSKGSEGIGTHLEPDFECHTIDGEISAWERKDILRAVEHADKAILSNARCLIEGVNLPGVDCVALFSPWKSRINIAQAIGRAMRKAPGKEVGYVLVPVYIELDEDCEQAARRSNFDVALDVLQTLKEQDEVLAELLREIVARKVSNIVNE
jgi:predicted helicase